MRSGRALLGLAWIVALMFGGCGIGGSSSGKPGLTIPTAASLALSCGAEATSDGYEPVFFGMPTPSSLETPMELARRFAVRLSHSHDASMTPHEVTRSASLVVIRFDDASGAAQGVLRFEQTSGAWELTHLETCPSSPESYERQPTPAPQQASSE